MSAYIVSDNTVKLIAIYAATPHTGMPDLDKASEVANMLSVENYASISYRYGDSSDIAIELSVTQKDVIKLRQYKLPQVIACAHNLEYQSCEHPTWKESNAYTLLHEIYDRASFELATSLGAAWGIE